MQNINEFVTQYSHAVTMFREKVRELGYLGPMHKIIQNVDAEDKFNLGGISLRDILQDTYACMLYLLIGFTLFTLYTGTRNDKKVAWILSLIVSVTEVFISLPTVYRFFNIQGGSTYPYVYRSDDMSRFAVIVFISFMIMDLVLGNIFYQKRIDILSGYFHHIFYLGLLSYSLQKGFSNCFIIFLPLEVPTAILSLASVFPALRNDQIFGLSFFICRIVYHSILMIELINDVRHGVPEVNIAIPCCLAFSLHVYWMSNWLKKYAFSSTSKPSEIDKRKRNELRSNATWIEKKLSEEDPKSEKAQKLKKELESINNKLRKSEVINGSKAITGSKTLKDNKASQNASGA